MGTAANVEVFLFTIFDPRIYNLGFVSQQDLPYGELAAAARAAHGRMYPVHAGRLPPAQRQARVR